MPEHRTILHLDLNAFFASVEQQANPELQGKAIAVVGGGGRTVITTSSYEARAKGVKTGMAIRGANNIIALRCSQLSNRWEDFWEYRAAA